MQTTETIISLLKNKQPKQAFTLAIKIDDLATLSYAAHIFVNFNELDLAKKLTSHILKKDHSFIPAMITKATIARKQGNFLSAKTIYEDVLTINKNCDSAWFNLGVLAEHQQEFSQAISYYQAADKINPCQKNQLRIGICLQKQNKHAAAITCFTSITQNSDTTVMYHLALSLQQEQRVTAAAEQFENILLIEPNHIAAQHGLATIYVEQKNYELAIAAFIQVLRIQPEHTEALHNLASVYYHTQKFKDALYYWLKMLAINPDQYTNYNIGSCYLALQKHSEAQPYLIQACQDLPESTDPIVNLASIYIKREDWKKVIALYNEALAINPNNSSIKYVLSALEQNNQEFSKAPIDYVTHLFDQYAHTFEQHLLENLEYQAHNIIAQHLNQHVPDGKYNILDLGCGTGLCGEACQHLAKKIIGVDLSSKMLDVANKKNIYHELHEQEIEQYLTQTNDIDIIIAADVIPYIGDISNMSILAYNALNEAGLFVFTIEASNKPDLYHLSESGRYQHNAKLLTKALAKDWQLVISKSVTTRTQNNVPVTSQLIMLRKPVV